MQNSGTWQASSPTVLNSDKDTDVVQLMGNPASRILPPSRSTSAFTCGEGSELPFPSLSSEKANSLPSVQPVSTVRESSSGGIDHRIGGNRTSPVTGTSSPANSRRSSLRHKSSSLNTITPRKNTRFDEGSKKEMESTSTDRQVKELLDKMELQVMQLKSRYGHAQKGASDGQDAVAPPEDVELINSYLLLNQQVQQIIEYKRSFSPTG